MVARFGSTEFDLLSYMYLMEKSFFTRFKYYIEGISTFLFPSNEQLTLLVDKLTILSGFFPAEISLADKYTDYVFTDIPQLDILGIWRNEIIIKNELNNVKFVRMTDIEPYDYDEPWSKALEGKKVLVVHPFAATIQEQYTKRKLLWQNKDVLPQFELKTLKAIQSIGGECKDFPT